MNKKIAIEFVLGIIIIIAIILGVAFWMLGKQKVQAPTGKNSIQSPKACTMMARVCPDGSSVSPTGPNCEFAPCPGESVNNSSNLVPNDLSCITEPGKSYYPPKEKCCNGLKSIFGSDLPANECKIIKEQGGGVPICAPCGNGKCENNYGENNCSCPEDCK